MRALCGAIISAGALIGLGLFSIGAGIRYERVALTDALNDNKAQWVHFSQLDTPLVICLVALLILLAIGLGIALLGLAYHHHRRHYEMLGQQRGPSGTTPEHRVTV
jgi:hypothetical protein